MIGFDELSRHKAGIGSNIARIGSPSSEFIHEQKISNMFVPDSFYVIIP